MGRAEHHENKRLAPQKTLGVKKTFSITRGKFQGTYDESALIEENVRQLDGSVLTRLTVLKVSESTRSAGSKGVSVPLDQRPRRPSLHAGRSPAHVAR